MTVASLPRVILVVTSVCAYVVGCSGGQLPSNAASSLQEPASGQPLESFATVQKCQNSPNLRVVPCHLTFTKDRYKVVSVEGGSGYARLLDNCERYATIFDASGPAWIVRPKKAKGTCAAVFFYDRQFAILTIHDEL